MKATPSRISSGRSRSADQRVATPSAYDDSWSVAYSGLPLEVGGAVLDVASERRRVHRQLEHVVEQLPAGTVAEPHAELPEPAGGQALARVEQERLVVESSMDVADPGTVLRVALEVALVHVDDAAVRRGVDVVDRAADRRQAAGDERLAQPLGRDRQVGHRGEAAEALAEHAPALDAELAPDRLGVADDRIRPEVGQVVGLRLGRVARDDPADRRRSAGPALVEQQHAVVAQRRGPSSPWAGGRARRLDARSALEEEEIRPIDGRPGRRPRG